MANFKTMTFEQRYARIQKYRVTPEDFVTGSAKEGWYIRHYSPHVNKFNGKYNVSSGTRFGAYAVKTVGKPYKNNSNDSFTGGLFKIGHEAVFFGEKERGEKYLTDLAMYGQCYRHNSEVRAFFDDIQNLHRHHEMQAIAVVNGLGRYVKIEDFRTPDDNYDYDYDEVEFE